MENTQYSNGIWTATPCPKPATWRGPQDSMLTLTRQWRACDEHRFPSDEPLEPEPSPDPA